MTRPVWLAALVVGSVMLSMLAGCGGGYVIHGKAVRDGFTSVSFVRPGDARLEGPGISNVEVLLYRDPMTLGREVVARGRTDDQGVLYLPVKVFGAGWLDEQWMIATYRPGYESAMTFMTLPDKNAGLPLLITLGPGVAERPPPTDAWSQSYEDFK